MPEVRGIPLNTDSYRREHDRHVIASEQPRAVPTEVWELEAAEFVPNYSNVDTNKKVKNVQASNKCTNKCFMITNLQLRKFNMKTPFAW